MSSTVPDDENFSETSSGRQRASDINDETSNPSAIDNSNLNDVHNMQKVSKKLENPLYDIPQSKLISLAEEFVQNNGLDEDKELFIRAALVAQNPRDYSSVPGLTDEEKEWIGMETTHKWHHPWQLYFLAIANAMAAVVQGMDETVVNGAQLFYLRLFGIENDDLLTGLVNGAPYLCCAVLGCWLTAPLNNYLGRRGTIFLSCVIAALASIWEAFTYNWQQLFVARFVLGLGIGPKSATVPVYAAETAPANIRGALVMQWQAWTAFGIMLGNLMSVAFYSLPDDVGWRIMLGSTVVAPIIVCAQVYLCPESPRWYLKRHDVQHAYASLLRLRNHRIQAARDVFYMHYAIKVEEESQKGRNLLLDFVKVPRVTRACLASTITMFMQQFCGINVIAYYSSQIFVEAGFSQKSGILASLGCGIINWLFALPAFYTIDTFGRRNLLLTTFPLMGLCLFFVAGVYHIPQSSDAHIGLIALGIYLFEVVYSPGEGPVPFTYSAEVYPLTHREVGMSLATATTWLFNFILSFTWPRLRTAFTPSGAFAYYGAWNIIGFFLVFLFLPESRQFTLEELDVVFSKPTREFAMYHIRHIPYDFRTKILRQKLPPKQPLYDFEYGGQNIKAAEATAATAEEGKVSAPPPATIS
ncbi:hypothetical protein Dda_5756 [Drechslerella dactyloides]|uniref:Major facilitator superfamily (MFS) profile domain-containing protein n=1 Tax=Drechslerella dactyloides TaxID=74499 RepID=A0AAD6IUW4_DREDA|nr:hypothetical protein Dda_5756 [Drechslerella dactyloides]